MCGRQGRGDLTLTFCLGWGAARLLQKRSDLQLYCRWGVVVVVVVGY